MGSSDLFASGKPQGLLAIWLFVSTAAAVGCALFNVAMDPYLVFGTPRVAGLNARKPAVTTRQLTMKAYDVLRAAPATLLLNSSGVALGIDARNSAWPRPPVYNLAVPGGTPYISHRYLQHTLSRVRPQLVVIGLQYDVFLLAQDRSGREDFERRLLVTRQGIANDKQRFQYLYDFFHSAFSLDSLLDSGATLTANIIDRPPDLVDGNWKVDTPVASPRWSSLVKTAFIDQLRTQYLVAHPRVDPLVFSDLTATVELCLANDIQMVLSINPLHADMMEIMDLSGHWEQFEDWKRELVALVKRYEDASGHRIPLWDFTGYDAYSTESVTPDHVLQWFFDPVHYTPALGDIVIKKITGTSNSNFGVLLNSEIIEPHLASIREQRRLYRDSQLESVYRVRYLYSSQLATMNQTR